MPFTPTNPFVWIEIPVTDMDRAMAFYHKVFGYDFELDTTGPNPMATFTTKDDASGVAGHLCPGKPAAKGTGITAHMEIPDTLDAAKARVIEAGGTIELGGAEIEIPSGTFSYATDPDGNSFGLYQPKR
jgi:predicted enzyme related to lactoylglutathione lyase